ncbi:MAG TPA: hypothetical protein VET27_05115 [Mycobacterium sp.]|nr:hypothetical protein [Mycobacterium sp.]
MPVLVEWQLVPGGWVQVFVDEDHDPDGNVIRLIGGFRVRY